MTFAKVDPPEAARFWRANHMTIVRPCCHTVGATVAHLQRRKLPAGSCILPFRSTAFGNACPQLSVGGQDVGQWPQQRRLQWILAFSASDSCVLKMLHAYLHCFGQCWQQVLSQ
jgi:hypothetical protein